MTATVQTLRAKSVLDVGYHKGALMPRVLLVEDTADVREVLWMALQAGNHEVTTVSTCEEAMPIISAGALDLLITDLKLPDCNGMELVKKADSLGIPQLLITGDVNATLDANIAGRRCLEKPFPLNTFLEAVKASLA